MRRAWVALVVLGLVGCATPHQRAERDCERQVADEMGWDVMPDGSWAPRPGTAERAGGGDKVVGSGARIAACLRARGF
jgi:hypothetical protein